MGRVPRRIVPRVNMSWTPRPNSRHSALMQSWKFNHSRFALGWRRGNRAYLVSSTEDCTAHPVIASLCDNLSCRDRLDKQKGKSGPLCPICQRFVSFFFFFSLFSAIFPPNSPLPPSHLSLSPSSQKKFPFSTQNLRSPNAQRRR